MVENIGDLALSQDDVNCINTLALAYIGDCIWEIYVRNYVLAKNKFSKVNKLHLLSTKYVKAKTQADIVKTLKENNIIDENMWDIVLRGRNSATNPPKNANVQEYNYATGFEALIGYLYIKKNYSKLDEIAQFCLK
ncbi:MAG: Mini-ribonuclease 3 [Peptoanaerobacter stomatis]|uniref:Mini-ribonuclease 3 n=1 Tax=Peptoanaerobacter stomatis TaxID=796937 RepID=UPI003FA09E87